MPLRPLLLAVLLSIPSTAIMAQTAQPTLVQVFTEWYGRHPIGTVVAPSRTEPVDAATLGLPALPAGQRYVAYDGMVVKVDAAWTLLGIARRLPETPTPVETVPSQAAPASGATAEANANVTVTVVTGGGDGEEDGDEDDGASRALTAAEAAARGVRIPRGHLPAAGTCRIWIPGTPPGRQPRGAVDCETDDVPDGALLIRG